MSKKIQIIISLAFSLTLFYLISSDKVFALGDPFATVVCCDAAASNFVIPGPGEECASASYEEYYCVYEPPVTDICCDSGATNYVEVDMRDVFSPYQCHTNEPFCSYKTKVCSIEGDPNYRSVINGDTEEYSNSSPPCSQYTNTSCTVTALFTKTSSGVRINGEAMRTFNVTCGSIDQVAAANALANIAAAAASPSTPLGIYQNTGGVVLYRVLTKDYCPNQNIPGDDTGVPIGYTKNSQNGDCVLDCESINQIPSPTGYGCIEPTVATCGTATSTGPYSYAPTQNLCEHGSASPTPVTTNSNTYSWTCTDHNNITGTTTASCSTPRDTSCVGNPYCEDLCSNIGGTQTQYYLDNHVPPMYTYTYTINHPTCTPMYQTSCTINPDTGYESCVDVYIGDSCVNNYQTLTGCREEEDNDYCLNYSGIQSMSFITTNNLTRDQYGMCWGNNGSCGPAINSSTVVPPTAGYDGYNLCLPASTITDPVTFNEATNKYEWSCTTTQGNQTSSCSSNMGCDANQKNCNGVCIPKSQQCGNTPTQIINSVKVNPKVIRNSGDKCIVTWNTLKSSGNDTLVCTFDKSSNGITESATGSTTSSWRRTDVTTGDHTINCILTTESGPEVADSGTARCSENPKFIEF